MSNTICVSRNSKLVYAPFRWGDEGQLYAWIDNAWVEVQRTQQKNRYGEWIFNLPVSATADGAKNCEEKTMTTTSKNVRLKIAGAIQRSSDYYANTRDDDTVELVDKHTRKTIARYPLSAFAEIGLHLRDGYKMRPLSEWPEGVSK